LLPLLKECLDSRGVHLIDVPVDYSENNRILNDDLPRRSTAL
jgi:acetolactate synthase-1/2/3 large subunit